MHNKSACHFARLSYAHGDHFSARARDALGPAARCCPDQTGGKRVSWVRREKRNPLDDPVARCDEMALGKSQELRI